MSNRARGASRVGFTLIELIFVVVIIGLIALMSAPRAATMMDRTNAAGARRMVTELVGKARSSAIMRGGAATVIIAPTGLVWVTAPKVGTPTAQDTVGAVQHLDAKFGVTVVAPTAQTTIGFDAQGVGTAAGPTVVILQRGAAVDTLTISASGRTSP